MTFDDDPNNDEPQLRLAAWARGFVWVLVLIAFVLLALRYCSVAVRAQDRGYMPPAQYTRPQVEPQAVAPEDPLEYYAEDWVVLDQDKRTVCRDPYIMRDIKIIKCVGRDPVR